MSFLSNFESKEAGVNDTVEFVIRVAIVTLSAVILVVVMALVVGLFMPNEIVDSAAVLEMVNPAFQTIIGAFVGLLGGLSLNANIRDAEPPAPSDEPVVDPEPSAPFTPTPEPLPLTEVYASPAGTVVVHDDDDDDDLAPWEKYRNDLRYDINGDGVIDENDFPDWRSAGR